MAPYVLSLDQGTTSSRAMVFDGAGQAVAMAAAPLTQHYPRPGWVEHDPEEIWRTQLAVAREAVAGAGITAAGLAAVGIANQRETTIVWEAATGRPLAPAIVWQCRRSAGICAELQAAGWQDEVTARTGLVLDPYFSGTKLKWLLDHTPGLRERARNGDIRFGTVDSWLLWNLTGGRRHITDVSNASRTLLFNIHTLDWDAEILAALDIPRALLPEVCPSSEVYGVTEAGLLGGAVSLAAAAGDQQAALFGQACFQPGMVKCTYGTGLFAVMHTGARPVRSRHGLLTTVAWGLDGGVEYALEGSVFIAGAAVQWLRDGLGIIASAAETEALAESVPDTGGVYLVPAFVGLGAPHWDPGARGALVGLTRGTTRAHIVRAALEAIAYQCRDVLSAMAADAGVPIPCLRVDGGAAVNRFLLQFQADILGIPVERPPATETTALGAAYLAGLAAGVWPGRAEIARHWQRQQRFDPTLAAPQREDLYRGWQRAVARSLAWAEPEAEPGTAPTTGA